MAVLMTSPVLQFFGSDGVTPLSGGKVYTYEAGTTTNKAAFTTAAGDVQLDNPIILDSVGKASIWISGSYKFIVKDSLDVTISTTDNVTSFTALPSASNAYFETFSGNGSLTAFTTSDDLGTDEKAIYVWVDASVADEVGYEIVNPSAYTISGTTLTFSTAPASGTNNIYVSAPSLLVGAASSSAADAAASAAAAATSETQAGVYAGQLTITSTTSLAIETGSKAFTVAADLALSAGQFILIASDADPDANFMWGTIASYSGTTLTVIVATIGGSGTLADWTMYLTGERGATGVTGSISDISGVSSGTPVDADTFIFTDISDSNATKKVALNEIKGVLRLLETQTASSSASIDFTSSINSTYKSYMLRFTNVIPVTNAVSFNLTASTDGGSSYIAGTTYEYQSQNLVAGNTTYSASASSGASSLLFASDVGNNTNESGISGDIIITNPSSSSLYKAVRGDLIHMNDSVNAQGGVLIAQINTASAVNALRISASTGSILSGIIELHGIR